MTDEQNKEALSALMDGELPHSQSQRLLDQVLSDPQLRDRWQRQHLISAALSSQQLTLAPSDNLAGRVSAALDHEDVVPITSAQKGAEAPAPRRSWTIAFALAAGVAAVALATTLGLFEQNSEPDPVQAIAQSAPASLPAASSTAVAAPAPQVAQVSFAPQADNSAAIAQTRMTWNDAKPAVEARLNSYLLDHNEYLADGVRGMLPYARVVGYDSTR